MDYYKKLEQNEKKNEKYLQGFEKWLNNQKLSKKTINNHISNADLYINYYLTYYDIKTPEEGIKDVYIFLNGWFIEKCMWSSKNSIKTPAASLKKFYKYMVDSGYIKESDYKEEFDYIKDNMDDFYEQLKEYKKGTYYDNIF